MDIFTTLCGASTYRGPEMMRTTSMRFSGRSAQRAASSSPFTSALWVLGWRCAHSRVTPNTFSGQLFQIS